MKAPVHSRLGHPGAGGGAGRCGVGHAAGHDQHIGRGGAGKVRIGQHAQARAGAHRGHAAGHTLHHKRCSGVGVLPLVHAAGGGEDLIGPAQVQGLHVVEHQDGDL